MMTRAVEGAGEAAGKSQATTLEERIAVLEKRVDGRGSFELSLFSKILLAVAIPLVPAIFGLTQFLVEQEAAKRAFVFECQKHEDKQLDEAVQQFIGAESLEQRVRIVHAFRGLKRSREWVQLIEAMMVAVKNEGAAMAEGGALSDTEAAKVDSVVQLAKDDAKSYRAEVGSPEGKDAALPEAPKMSTESVESKVKKQYVQIAASTNCEQLVKDKLTLQKAAPAFDYAVWRGNSGNCALTVGGSTLDRAKLIAADWRALHREPFLGAFIISEVHFAERIDPSPREG